MTLARGNAAQQAGNPQDAYRHWRRAAQLDPDSQGSESAASLEAKARDLYRDGYRLEQVNLAKAKTRWQQVLELVPPGSDYHTKATAKLRFYSEIGQ